MCIRDSYRSDRIQPGVLDRLNIKCQKQIAGFNTVAGLDFRRKRLALQIDGIQADMEQNFRAVGGCHA